MSTTDESVAKEAPTRSGRDLHRRETRNQIVLPFLLAVVFVTLIVLFVAFLNNPQARTQVRAIADFVLSVTILCPAILCLFPIYLLVVVGVYGANKLHAGTQKPLERLETLTNQARERVSGWTDGANSQVSHWSARIEPLMKIMSIFDEPTTKTEESHNNVSKPE